MSPSKTTAFGHEKNRPVWRAIWEDHPTFRKVATFLFILAVCLLIVFAGK